MANDVNENAKERKFLIWFIVLVVLAVAAAITVATSITGDPITKLKLACAYGVLVLLFLFGVVVLAAIASGKINISELIEEETTGASTSRFQLLIFTFVIGISFALIVACECKFPDVPTNVLALLGVSASTYGVSKGITAGASNGSSASNTTATSTKTDTDQAK